MRSWLSLSEILLLIAKVRIHIDIFILDSLILIMVLNLGIRNESVWQILSAIGVLGGDRGRILHFNGEDVIGFIHEGIHGFLS
jgi:hypothetical protein